MEPLSSWNIGDWVMAIVTVLSFAFLIWQVLRSEGMLPVENLSIRVERPHGMASDTVVDGVVYIGPSSDYVMRIVDLSAIDGCETIKDREHNGVADYLDRDSEEVSLHIRQTGPAARLLLVWRQPSRILGRPVASAKRITVDLHGRHPSASFETWRWRRCARVVHLANMLFHRQWSEGLWTRSGGYWKDSLPENAGLYPCRHRSEEGSRSRFQCRHGSRTLRI